MKTKKQWEMDRCNVTRLAENPIHYTCDYDEIDFELVSMEGGIHVHVHVHVCDYWIWILNTNNFCSSRDYLNFP